MMINVKDRIILLHNPKTGGRFRGNACGNKYFKSERLENDLQNVEVQLREGENQAALHAIG